MRTIPITALTLTAGLLLAGCGAKATAGQAGAVEVVAAENMWGSIAAQIGGQHAHVTSIVNSPDADPHDYEPSPQDARTIAGARYLVVNGAGYDPWAQKLADASANSDRIELSVADLAGRKAGDNPHMWYSPSIVAKVAQRISDDLTRIDPGDADYFAQRRAGFMTTVLAQYNTLRDQIREGYKGVPVGATESIFIDLAADLELDLRTPPAFMNAVSEGDDPTPQDKAAADAQIAQRQIKVLVFNSQNSTPDIQRLVDAAKAAHIPVVPITETPTPAGASFQDWQAAQLEALLAALRSAA
jgi:zinc/manganese transport system substrate-binding protein